MPSLQEILTFFHSRQVPDDTSQYPTGVFFTEFPLVEHGNEPPFPIGNSTHYKSQPRAPNPSGKIPGFIQSGGYGCTYLVRLNSGELAVAKVMFHPTAPDQLKRLTVDLVGMTQIPPVGDGRSSLIKLLHLRHNSTYICMIVSTVQTTPISASLVPELQIAYGNRHIRASNWGFVKDVFEWVCSGQSSIPCGGVRPYIILKQLLEAVNRLHKGGIIHRDIKVENLVVGVELSVRCEPHMGGRPAVTERWNTMLIDLGWAKMIAQGYKMPVSGGGCAIPGFPPAATTDSGFEGDLHYEPLPTAFVGEAPLSGWPKGWHIVIDGLGMAAGTTWTDSELMAADIWACGLVFATMLFRKHPLRSFTKDYAWHISDEKEKIKFATKEWPTHSFYQDLFAKARRDHGTLWEPILMRMMPARGELRQYVSAEDLLREPLLGALTGDHVHRPESFSAAPAAPVAIFAARPATQPPPPAAAAAQPAPETRTSGGRDPVNVVMTETHEKDKGPGDEAPKAETAEKDSKGETE